MHLLVSIYKMNYHITTVIWLSLEDFYNRGLTPEQAKTIIEAMDDPAGGSLRLRCENQFINGNWNVHTGLLDQHRIYNLVLDIYRSLEMAVEYKSTLVSN